MLKGPKNVFFATGPPPPPPPHLVEGLDLPLSYTYSVLLSERCQTPLTDAVNLQVIHI